ncbi:hypothetical protein [Streptomyces sp. NPDC002994]|uniref:hypothetical protein n=1 Tax=Streptomyces sp. NPDC002994 TaxID=3154441 RepID=UPI0033B7D85B
MTDAQGHTYEKPCLYGVSFTARDDDGAAASHRVPVSVQGERTCVAPGRRLVRQYLTGDLTGLGKERLTCYLKTVRHASAVFSETVDVSTREKAADTLFLALLDPERAFDRQLLAAWLNFANGSFGPGEKVDTDGDLKADTPFLEAVQHAEKVRLDPDTTRKELAAQAKILTCVNVPLV